MDDLDRDDWWELWWGEDQRIDDTAQNPNGDGERTSVRFHEGHLSLGCITVAQGQVEWQIVKRWLQSMDSAFELTDYEDGELSVASLQSFVHTIVDRKIFDGEKLSELVAPLELGWKDRTKKETAIMTDLIPLLKRMAEGQKISGLSAYE